LSLSYCNANSCKPRKNCIIGKKEQKPIKPVKTWLLTDEKRRLLKLIEPWGGVNETEETGRGQASVDYANQKSATKGLSAAASLRNTLGVFCYRALHPDVRCANCL
jgi:hypothetical protein